MIQGLRVVTLSAQAGNGLSAPMLLCCRADLLRYEAVTKRPQCQGGGKTLWMASVLPAMIRY
jgi:hypothetical protein